MRDPARIPVILERLSSLWTHYPDMRLGQLLCNVTDTHVAPDLFSLEDDRTAELLTLAAESWPVRYPGLERAGTSGPYAGILDPARLAGAAGATPASPTGYTAADLAHTTAVLDDVRAERARQRGRYSKEGDDAKRPADWIALLVEQFGTTAVYRRLGTVYRVCLLQVAATAVAAIEALDRNERTTRMERPDTAPTA